MKIAAYSNIGVAHGNSYTAAPKYKVAKPVKMEKMPEHDVRSKKQASYIVGMSLLSLASFVMSTKGKTGLNIRV